MEGKIRKRIGETFENQMKARNKHIAEINNPDIKSVRKESKLNCQLKIQVNEIEIDPVLRHMKKSPSFPVLINYRIIRRYVTT